MADNTYDAIVIGSGISGGWAAKELTEKGLKTIMLERGEILSISKTIRAPAKTPGISRTAEWLHKHSVPTVRTFPAPGVPLNPLWIIGRRI